MTSSGDDRRWMAQALALGALAEGGTSPNPRVGCLLVRDGRVVGCGHHRSPGQPHAEALAVAAAGGDARGATLYVNLEPCAHHGRTPPCTELLLRSGVARVVAAVQDPDPRVDGRGFDALRRGGVAVDVGPMEDEARRLNEPFFHWQRTARPLVTLKAAVSLDGLLSADGGRSKWISGAPARRFAHRLRLRHDAVLVGAGTVRSDDPRLTVRLAGTVAPPRRLRAVLSASLDLDPRARIFEDASAEPVRLFTSEGRAASGRARFGGRAEVVGVADRGQGLDLEEVLERLGRAGVQSLLVEGGARTHAAFLEAGAVDRIALFVAGRLLGGRGGTPLLDRPTVAEPAMGWRVDRREVIALGEDVVVAGVLRAGNGSAAP